jgi:hypothetical protein
MASDASRSDAAARSRARLRGAVAALLGAAAVALALPARADQVVGKRFRFEERDGQLTISGGFRELLDERLRQRLRSGFATSVVMRVYVYSDEGAEPLSATARTLRAVYDLWEEIYLLRFEEPGRNQVRRLRAERDVVDRLTSFWRFPLGPIARFTPGRQYFVAALVEINPMQSELLAEVRRWLRRPSLAPHHRGEASFFGSFVSIFVNDNIRRAEKTFKVRSQPFYRSR